MTMAAALLVTRVHGHASADELAGKERDVLRLSWHERRWTRRRTVTGSGRAIALALPTGTLLAPGEVIAVDADWFLVVEARPEPVLAVFPRSADEAVWIAFDVGNRHFPLALAGDALLVPDDTAMEQMLARTGVPWERRDALFEPIGGGGHRTDAGRSGRG
jgi:urease accessory protein